MECPVFSSPDKIATAQKALEFEEAGYSIDMFEDRGPDGRRVKDERIEVTKSVDHRFLGSMGVTYVTMPVYRIRRQHLEDASGNGSK